jgi:hypothetical protein
MAKAKGRNFGPRSRIMRQMKPVRIMPSDTRKRTVFTPLIIEYVARCMVRRERKYDIAKQVAWMLRDKRGKKKLRPGQVERMLREARMLIKDRLAADPAELKALSLATYDDNIRRAHQWGDLREVRQSQERIDAILGHDAKFKDPTIDDIERVRRMNEMLIAADATMKEATDGDGSTEGDHPRD